MTARELDNKRSWMPPEQDAALRSLLAPVEWENCPTCGQRRLVTRDDTPTTLDCDLCRPPAVPKERRTMRPAEPQLF